MSRVDRVLHRSEAQQMATDLGDVIDTVIGIAADADSSTKVMAFDALVVLHTKRSTLQYSIADADREAAQRDLDVLKRAAAQREGGAQ